MAYANGNDSNGDATRSKHASYQQSEELYNRSAMLIIWHKARSKPLRIYTPIPTWPYLSIAQFPSLISSLSLNQNSFFDAWNPVKHQWEQHLIHTVFQVKSGQAVLYRLRRSLLEGIDEADCPGLKEELLLQTSDGYVPITNGMGHPSTAALSRKRSAIEAPNGSLPSPPKYHASDTNHYVRTDDQPQPHQVASPIQQHQPYTLPTQSATYPGASSGRTKLGIETPRMQAAHAHDSAPLSPDHLPAPPLPPNQDHTKPYIYNSTSTSLFGAVTTPPPQHPISQSTQHQPQQQQPQQQHQHQQQQQQQQPTATPAPPLTVPIPYHPHPPLKRWPNDYTVSEIAAGFAQMDELVALTPTLTQRAAFERVFNCRYVKSTVCRHRGVWRRADDATRNAFVEMKLDERAVWGEFVRRVEGRASALQDVTPVQVPAVSVQVQVQEEAVMGSLAPPPPEHSMQQRTASFSRI